MKTKENYILIQENSFEKAKKKIKDSKERYKERRIVFSGKSDSLNRKVLEKLPIDIILLNMSGRKDFQKQKNSGFNQVIAKIAKKNNITIGINLGEILEAKQRVEILSRIKQNIALCRKNNLKMKFISIKQENTRDIYDLKALGLVLGMPTSMVKQL